MKLSCVFCSGDMLPIRDEHQRPALRCEACGRITEAPENTAVTNGLPSVLVVEDDSAARRGLCELLAAAGWHATGAASLQQAEDLVRTDPPDLLITDIRLSGYNGLQLVWRFPEIPAIVITGYADPVIERDALAAGATYIRKPINPAEMLRLVNEKLNPRK